MEESQVQATEAVAVSNEQESVQQSAPSMEDVARSQGWKPKEEYDGDPSRWVSAETFVAKGELIDKIENLGRELKEQKRANAMLLEHHKKVKESEFSRAIEFLKAQKKAALEEGDAEKVVELDEQLATVRETQTMQKQTVQQAPAIHPEFAQWVNGNDWYAKDAELRSVADAMGMRYAQNNPGITPKDVLDFVSKQIKKNYPEKFTNPNRSRPSAVEGASQASTRKSDDFTMTDEEKQVMNTFVRSGIMSKDEYMAELKKMKGVK